MSGGNAQKVVVAREVSVAGKLLIASQPTRGVDIGAIESIRSILQDVKTKGLGVLLVSADLEEILSLSDRIVVMHEGKIAGSMYAEEANEENLGLLMMGGNKVRKERKSIEWYNEELKKSIADTGASVGNWCHYYSLYWRKSNRRIYCIV